ncbi:dTMP kinase [Acrasis kona]|uniref:Thymidylate kinase n=1 Tax=Acrasis kona TaxID=1008807 RepID=A0AAW2Z2L6_9EUKA
MIRGCFIVFEGLDRCGKTTQIDLLMKALVNKGVKCAEYTFPDRSTFIGGACGAYLKNEKEMNDKAIHLMFSANRWEKEKQILDTLHNGESIICSRYAYSGVAYSCTKPGMDFNWCKQPDRGLPEPDLVLFLDIDVDEAAKRSEYGQERYEKKEVQKKVLEQFENLMKGDPKFSRISASRPIEVIHADIMEKVQNMMKDCASKEVSKLWMD